MLGMALLGVHLVQQKPVWNRPESTLWTGNPDSNQHGTCKATLRLYIVRVFKKESGMFGYISLNIL